MTHPSLLLVLCDTCRKPENLADAVMAAVGPASPYVVGTTRAKPRRRTGCEGCNAPLGLTVPTRIVFHTMNS